MRSTSTRPGLGYWSGRPSADGSQRHKESSRVASVSQAVEDIRRRQQSGELTREFDPQTILVGAAGPPSWRRSRCPGDPGSLRSRFGRDGVQKPVRLPNQATVHLESVEGDFGSHPEYGAPSQPPQAPQANPPTTAGNPLGPRRADRRSRLQNRYLSGKAETLIRKRSEQARSAQKEPGDGPDAPESARPGKGQVQGGPQTREPREHYAVWLPACPLTLWLHSPNQGGTGALTGRGLRSVHGRYARRPRGRHRFLPARRRAAAAGTPSVQQGGPRARWHRGADAGSPASPATLSHWSCARRGGSTSARPGGHAPGRAADSQQTHG